MDVNINNMPIIKGRDGSAFFDKDIEEFLKAVDAEARCRDAGPSAKRTEEAIHDVLREGLQLYYNMKKVPLTSHHRREVRRSAVAICASIYVILAASTNTVPNEPNERLYHPGIRPGVVALGLDIQNDVLNNALRPTRWAPGYVYSRLMGKVNDLDAAVKEDNVKNILRRGGEIATWMHAVYAMSLQERPPGSMSRDDGGSS